MLACLASQLVAGCGALEENTPDRLEFDLPAKQIVLDKTNRDWRDLPSSGWVSGVICAGPLATTLDCCSAAGSLVVDCNRTPLVCDPTDSTCTMVFDIAAGVDVALGAEVPAIQAVQGRVFSRVELGRLTATADSIGNLPLRSATLYIGPKGSLSPASPDVFMLSALAPGAGQSSWVPDEPTRQAFSSFARSYQAPFSLFVSAHVALKTPVSGAVKFTIGGRATAYY
jgi:hypothetical protein